MKGIIKLFPVAVAALSLASCNSDDFSIFNQTEKAPDNALSFTIESTTPENGTRAGIVGNVMSRVNGVQFKWTNGDVIRVYDNTMSEWNKFTYADGSFQDGTTFTPDAQNNTNLTYDLALYPADEVEAVYMDKDSKLKKHIEMSLPTVYNYEEKVDYTDENKAGYRCDMPMYGNVTNVAAALGSNQMNFLTAWTRVYLRDLPANVKYIALVSENADQPLTGRFRATVTYDAQGNVTDIPLLAAEDDLEPTWGNVVYAEVNTTAGTAQAAVKDSAAICFPFLAEQVYDKLTVYALTAGTDITTLKTESDWASAVAADKAFVIASRNDIDNTTEARTFHRKNCWTVRYTEPVVIDVDDYDPLLPGDLTDIINSKKNKAISELWLQIVSGGAGTDKTLHSSEGYERNHVTTIPKMQNGVDVKIDLSDAAATLLTDENWTINGDFDKKLTIIQGELASGSKATSKIEINLPNADVVIVSDGTNDLTNIDIQQANSITIGDGETSTKFATGKTLVVRDGTAYVTNAAVVEKVIADPNYTNNTKADKIVALGGGTISMADINTTTNVEVLGSGNKAANVSRIDAAGVKEDISIYSEGRAKIYRITAPTAAAGMSLLNITSKLNENEAFTTELGVINASDPAIFTAAQLYTASKNGTTAKTYIVADELDLNNNLIEGATLGADLIGYNYDETNTRMKNQTVASEKAVTTKTGATVIKNLKIKAQAENGLFGKLGAVATVAGFKVNTVALGGDAIAASTDLKIGAVVGSTNAYALTVDDVTVEGLAFNMAGASYLGGILGYADAAATITDAKVTGEIKGRGFIGGIIGGITTTSAAAVKIYTSETNVTFGNVVNLISGTSLSDLYAGTFGCFIGGDASAAGTANTIDIYDGKFGTAITKTIKGDGVNNAGLRFGAKANGSDIPFFGGNAWVGRFVNNAAAAVLTSYVGKSVDKKSYWKYTYSETQMVKTQWTDGTGAYTDGTQTTTAGATITYNGTETTYNTNGYRFGTNIFTVYADADVAYDAAYIDAAE